MHPQYVLFASRQTLVGHITMSWSSNSNHSSPLYQTVVYSIQYTLCTLLTDLFNCIYKEEKVHTRKTMLGRSCTAGDQTFCPCVLVNHQASFSTALICATTMASRQAFYTPSGLALRIGVSREIFFLWSTGCK